ncbi:MCE family protein [bacterium]|nr:MCE family protein [bacterium]
MAMIKHKSDKKIAVGGLISAAFLLAMAAIIIVSGQEGLLRHRYELRARMDQVNGLQVGAPVWLAGVNVGSVSDIIFIQNDTTGKTKIEIRMKIKKAVQDLITEDSNARIGTLGLLGDKYVAISLGDPEKRPLQDGDYITSANPIDFEAVLSKGVDVFDDVAVTVYSFKDIARKINKGEGTLGKLINDPNLYFSLEDFLNVVEKMADKVERNEGTIGLLFNDTTLYWNSARALEELAALTDTLKRGEGTLKMLLRDKTLYNNMISTVGKIDTLISQIQSGKGTTGALISNRELYEKLSSSISELDSLVSDIRQNPGKYLKVKVSLF